jgi:hypothetical protein
MGAFHNTFGFDVRGKILTKDRKGFLYLLSILDPPQHSWSDISASYTLLELEFWCRKHMNVNAVGFGGRLYSRLYIMIFASFFLEGKEEQPP